MKKVNLKPLSEKERRNAINEVRILASLTSKYVTKYKEVFTDKKHNAMCIVMEYLDNGDLFQQIVLHQKKNMAFREE